MGRLVVTEFMTVDGVMEAPGFDEHRSGRNAWALRLSDDDMQVFNRDQLRDADALLFGRTTYQIWAAFWPSLKDEASFGQRVNELPKYVVSKSLGHAEWDNTTILRGDPAEEAAALKARIDGELLVYGSARPGLGADERRARRRVPDHRVPGRARQRQAPVPRRVRPALPPPHQRAHVPVRCRAPRLRAGDGGARGQVRRGVLVDAASRSSRCTRRWTRIGSWRRCCSPTSSTPPGVRPRWATRRGASCSTATTRSPASRSSGGAASW